MGKKRFEAMIAMMRIRTASKAGVTARFAAGRFTITHDGVTEPVAVANHPRCDLDIMHTLEAILQLY
jgi:hypothetical protein